MPPQRRRRHWGKIGPSHERRHPTLAGSRRITAINWIAANPEAGDVIRGSGGCRKVRWTSAGQGKRGDARIIYFNANTETIWLLIVYKKAKFDNLPTSFLAELKQGVEDAL